jgi:dephospho-CoA kinase
VTERKRAIVVCGAAGAGKTTHAYLLARREGAVLIDIDTVSEKLVQAGLRALGHDQDDRDSPIYKQIYRDAIHETLFAVARDNLDVLPCVIVAPFTRERREADFKERLERELRTSVEIVYVHCDEKIRKARIAARKNPRDRDKLLGWESYSDAARDDSRPDFKHTFVDTSQADEPEPSK